MGTAKAGAYLCRALLRRGLESLLKAAQLQHARQMRRLIQVRDQWVLRRCWHGLPQTMHEGHAAATLSHGRTLSLQYMHTALTSQIKNQADQVAAQQRLQKEKEEAAQARREEFERTKAIAQVRW